MEETYALTVKVMYTELIEQFVITYGVVPDAMLDRLWVLANQYANI